MELRRLEGVFLEYAIDRHRAAEAYQASQSIAIRVRTQVPEVLLSLLGNTGSQLRAVVRENAGGKILLSLDNGYEILAENKLGISVNSGDRITLRVENREPLTLKVESLSGGVRGTEAVKNLLRAESVLTSLTDSVKQSLQNSGIVYERKVVDFLLGKVSFQELSNDQKFQALKALESVNLKEFVDKLKASIPARDTVLRGFIDSLEGALSHKDYANFMQTFKELKTYIDNRLTQLEGNLKNLPKEMELLRSFAEKPAERVTEFVKELPARERQPLEALLGRIAKGIETRAEVKSVVSMLGKVVTDYVARAEAWQTTGDKLVSTLKSLIDSSLNILFSKKPPPKAVVNNLIEQTKELVKQLPEGRLRDTLSELTNTRITPNENPQAVKETATRVLNALTELTRGSSLSLPQGERVLLREVTNLAVRVLQTPRGQTTEKLLPLLRESLTNPEQALKLVGQLTAEADKNPILREALESLKPTLENLRKPDVGAEYRRSEAVFRQIIEEVITQKKSETTEAEKEIAKLSQAKEALENLPKEAIKNMEKLDLIYQLQSFLVNTKGSKFFIPLLVKEKWKGVLAFSKREDSYRIFINIDMPEGFLGILMEAPKREFPDYMTINFKTDISQIEELINLKKGSLKREIEDLGIKVRSISVEGESRDTFEHEIIDEFGEGVFYMKV